MTNLKPGRELDALVAEKVMGRNTGANGRTGKYEIRGSISWADGRNETVEPRTVEIPEEHYIPSYSTSIEAAWEVVEHLVSNQLPYLCIYKNGLKEWAVQKTAEDYEPQIASAATAPLAICISALKVVGAIQNTE